ncbi:hypothetical protein RO575_09790 [Methylomonas sp. MO1]|uniref:hypothetical protein n=1 Tax=Methylomonas sp. MO1 TaxID=3073619 RepID=UPI0018CC6D81|nr:hypothetical protein [Methylomonas sp. MO1]MDT4289853.1 hypothetical protein [Methylomonas sp. MO1]
MRPFASKLIELMPRNKMNLKIPKKSISNHFTSLLHHYSFQRGLSQEAFKLNSFFFYKDLRRVEVCWVLGVRVLGKNDFYQKVNDGF